MQNHSYRLSDVKVLSSFIFLLLLFTVYSLFLFLQCKPTFWIIHSQCNAAINCRSTQSTLKAVWRRWKLAMNTFCAWRQRMQLSRSTFQTTSMISLMYVFVPPPQGIMSLFCACFHASLAYMILLLQCLYLAW